MRMMKQPKASPVSTRSTFGMRTKESLYGYLFILPNFLAMVAFLLVPIVYSLWISFTRWNIVTPPIFVGLQNYTVDMWRDQQFILSLRHTVEYSLMYIPLAILLAIFVAYLLSKNIRGVDIFRTIIFVPVTLSMVSVSMVWRWLLNTEFGVVNYVLSLIGIKAIPWLTSESNAMFSVVIISIWKNLGFNTVILIAAFKAVPISLYEAAVLDGANEWRKFVHVSLPLISPSIFFVSIMSVINSFQVFDVVYMTTLGGPGNATRVLYYWIYQNAFKFFDMGYASAMSWVLFIIIFLLTMLNMRYGSRRVTYDID